MLCFFYNTEFSAEKFPCSARLKGKREIPYFYRTTILIKKRGTTLKLCLFIIFFKAIC